jgi:hypothetical protein
MSPRTLLGCFLFLFISGIASLDVETASACAPAPPRNKKVEIADESAIIIWDAKNKTQHFIRRAAFQSDAPDFGFLVPTPSQPTLYESNNKAFEELARITAPRIVQKTRPSGGMSCGCGSVGEKANAPKAEVRVLEEKRVAGYDAVVLEADAPDALSQWLKDHGYDFSPALTDWAAPYVKAGWKITAFKVAKKLPDEPDVAASAVRMSFQTEKPFFPYREPTAPPQAAKGTASEKEGTPRRLLRVFFLSDSRVKGVLGEDGKAWPGKVSWANKVSGGDREKVLEELKLPGETPPAAWWLTEFEDHSSPRPGTADVYFSKDDDQSTVEREPHVQYVLSSVSEEVMIYALAACLLGLFVVSLTRRKAI